MELYTIKLCRYIQRTKHIGAKLTMHYLDEYNKFTVVKYRLKRVVVDKKGSITNYILRLDGRSIRYMQRVKIIENKV